MNDERSPRPAANRSPDHTSEKAWPLVTIAAPVLNEAPRLPALLASIEAQTYPADRLQILLIDGGSEDGTVALARRAAAHNDAIELLHNPKRLAAAALNLALARAQGAYFMRVDGRSRLGPDAVARAVARIEERGCAGVAGVQLAVGESRTGRIHALALNHPLGGGGARYRSARRLEESETLYLGLYATDWLRRVGGWDKTFAANEDFELNTRIRKNGGVLLVDPAIPITYVARDELLGLAKQYARYGAWRTVTWKRHHDAMRLRHLIPALFAVVLVLGLGMSPWSLLPLATVSAIYATIVFLVSFHLSLAHRLNYLPRLLVVFPTLHLSWGFAFWLAWLFPPSSHPLIVEVAPR
ncbi:MAG TPA: glycosyltransferase [Caldilineae bacterium]|nr:glycosyltransferase [Caldilineae bacterium]